MAQKFDRAVSAFKRGRLAEAEPILEAIVTADPDATEALRLLAAAQAGLGKLEAALASYDRVLALAPDDAAILANRGSVLARLERFEAALASYDRSLALRPDDGPTRVNHGNALRALDRFDEALASYDRALAREPDDTRALGRRAAILKALGRFDEALASYDRSLALRPDDGPTLVNRANTLRELGRLDEALATYDRALSLEPHWTEALYNRASALVALDRHEEALASFDQVLGLQPDHPFALSAAANCAAELCRFDRWQGFAERLAAHAANKTSRVMPFVLLLYNSDPACQFQCASDYARHKFPSPPPPLWQGERWRHEKIRIAYLSANFHRHAQANLIAELFECHDRSRFEVTAVSFGPDEFSAMRRRLVAAFDEFLDVRGKTDAEVARLLRDRRIDVAVDLKGYTQQARPAILSHRPAPIQALYLGYPGTMGAPFIDYVIADAVVAPFEHQPFYAEKIVHLPDCYQVNDRKRNVAEETPTRAGVGLPDAGFVFSCFNKSAKYTPQVFEVWMRLLHRVAGSVLWLHMDNEAAARNLRHAASAQGVDPSRLVFAGRMPLAQHLARQRLADLFLDTLPYNAHTTTSDALWMGLPVLTCQGDAFQARVAASLLRAVGLPELVTQNLQDYEAMAVRLATEPGLLSTIRAKLAANRLEAPLFDTDRFRRSIEAAYTEMWEIWQRGEAPRGFAVASPTEPRGRR